MVRAFNPWPGAEAVLGGDVVKVWEAEPVAGEGEGPGEIATGAGADLRVGCGSGALRLRVIQRAGGRKLDAADYLRGNVRLAALAGKSQVID